MFDVVRRNPAFRKLWLAQVVSQVGDWMSHVAVLGMIASLGGASQAAGVGMLFAGELALRLLPAAALGPFAGPTADRLPRRALMVTADLARAAVVLALIFVREPEHLPWLYVIVGTQMSLGVFFDSARAGALPNTIASKDDLHDAYALSAATWSAMLSIGALTGGLLVKFLAPHWIFTLDACTYVASALLLVGLHLPPTPPHEEAFRWRELLLFRDLRRGLAHVRERNLGRVLLAKVCWGPGGGFLVLLSLFGRDRFGGGHADSALEAAAEAGFATGVLYAARGVGTGVGPILARRFLGRGEPALVRQIRIGFFVAAAGYGLFAFSPNLILGAAAVAFAHCGGSALWVGSTTLWQRGVDDAFRGRTHSLEFLGATLAFSASGALAALGYDTTGSLTGTTLALVGLLTVTGTIWTVRARGLRT